jgi:TP53 regulating kinase-like protein
MTTSANSPLLPTPFNTSTSSPLTLITQGAEARIYRTTFLSPTQHIALKYRPKKSYRHSTLDARLTKARILAEARVLVRCRKEGVLVPGVLGLDWEEGWLACEWIEGRTVRVCLDEWLERVEDEEDAEIGGHSHEEGVEMKGEAKRQLGSLMERVGRAVGRLHDIGVVHGDLTTSNLMLRPRKGQERSEGLGNDLEGDMVLIDFGLAVQTVQDEDRAVDLYVLERAFGSTHPQAEGLFKEVLRAYSESYKGAKVVLKRLEDVRMRGRKKSMIG